MAELSSIKSTKCMNRCVCSDPPAVSSFEFTHLSYKLLECSQCGFIETKPVEKVDVDIYEIGHYQVKPYFYIPLLINFLDYLYIYVILKLRGAGRKKSVLDFGCGKGFFLYFLKLLKMEYLTGSETSVSRARFASEITKLNITTEYYSGGKIMDQAYDYITMIHVLEHIEEPFAFLEAMLDGALRKGGCLFIEVPNIDSTASKLAGKIWAHFTPHFHVNHFTPKSFIRFCEVNNLKYELVSTFSFYNSSMGMTSALLSLVGYKGSLFEDMKNKKIFVIVPFLIMLPITLVLETLLSILYKKGSVIKFTIYK